MLVSMDTLLRITGSAVVTDDAASTVNPVRTARLPEVPGDAGRDDILLALCFKRLLSLSATDIGWNLQLAGRSIVVR